MTPMIAASCVAGSLTSANRLHRAGGVLGHRRIGGVSPRPASPPEPAPCASGLLAPTICGRTTSLRLVEVADAPFIVRLRSGPRGARLSPVGTDLRHQEEWLRAYKQREARREELYFVIRHHDAGDVGTLRVHDLAPDSFWWGSWIVREGAPTCAAFESMFLLYELTFIGMDLRCARFVVRRDNPKIEAFHRRCGATTRAEDESRFVLELTRQRYVATRPRLARRFAASGDVASAAQSEQGCERLPSSGEQAR
jgi:RimJ/RimL family protein N-acetyltransferase